MYELAPDAAFRIERHGSVGERDAVVAQVTVRAASAAAAVSVAKTLLRQALPSVSFWEYGPDPDEDDRVAAVVEPCEG